MEKLILLQPADLVFALGLIAIALALSVWQRVGLEWDLLLASGRTLLQLLVVGYFLGAIFAWRNPVAILGAMAVMLTIAAITARNQIAPHLPRLLPLLWGAIFISTTITLTYTTLFVIRPPVWYSPQYLIPLGGIVLGNAMNGAALAGERLTRTLRTSRQEIETHLCLGASPQQAIAGYRRESVRAGLIPTLNTMMVVGIIQLPGMITGQLLSGVAPEEAASYQILVMFMLACTTLLTTLLVTTGLCRLFFNQVGQVAD